MRHVRLGFVGTIILAILALSWFAVRSASNTSHELNLTQASVLAAPAATVTANEWGFISATNDSFDRMFGYEPNERIGWPISSLMTEASAEQHEAAFYKAMQHVRETGSFEPKSYVCRAGEAVRKDGSTFWVAILLSRPIKLSNGGFYLVATIRSEEDVDETYKAISDAKNR